MGNIQRKEGESRWLHVKVQKDCLWFHDNDKPSQMDFFKGCLHIWSIYVRNGQETSDEQDATHVNHPPPKLNLFENKDCWQGTNLQDETDKNPTSSTSSDGIGGVVEQHMLGFSVYQPWLYQGEDDVLDGTSHIPYDISQAFFPIPIKKHLLPKL